MNFSSTMLVPLTSRSSPGVDIVNGVTAINHGDEGGVPATSPAVVGGKASSLAKLYSIPDLNGRVPQSYALSVSFFQSWMDILTGSDEYAKIKSHVSGSDRHYPNEEALVRACEGLKQRCMTISLDASQEKTLDELSHLIGTDFGHGLAAVRSSAVEEDGADASFAGMFETKLGVTPSKLEGAVRACFASKFDVRVFRYMAQQGGEGDDIEAISSMGGFALVVMEMVDSVVAGVSFSANPLNSDRDECVVDSSYGLGESVVDGSVTADHFVYDKVNGKLVEKVIGCKKVERRLNLAETGGDVKTITIDDEQRQNASSVSDEQLADLVRLTCIVEKEYGTPMDVEWAIDENDNLVLLQARPITTLFWLDDAMMTKPGEKRMLYYDPNIASEATTTTPFRHMDVTLYCRLFNALFGMNDDVELVKYDPLMPFFNASTRQYVNLSICFKYISPEYCAKEMKLLDPYLASLFASKDCDRARYKMKKLPKGVNLRNLWWILRQVPFGLYYKVGRDAKKNPEKTKEKYLQILAEDMAKLEVLKRRGYNKEEGLQKYSLDLFQCLLPSMNLEMGLIYFIVFGQYRTLDKKRREGKTEQIRAEYDALCGGYEGDELMQSNIDQYRLANTLDSSIWDQYNHNQLHLLAERIEQNLDGAIQDLPSEFLSEWKSFVDHNGWDGDDQLFISSPRYQDDHALLLARLHQNAGGHIKDPAITQREKVAERRRVMQLQEDRIASKRIRNPLALRKIRRRNAYLEHIMWIRNAPKLHLAKVYGILKANILRAEEDLIRANRLESKGDIFHLDLHEVDRAMMRENEKFDLMALVRPRKEVHERALRATECPLLIDSRCRILRPDPPSRESIEQGVLVGAAVSPGTATGRVRIMKSPTDFLESGEVLAATVTSPAWTPLFVGASAVVLQIGGALQHGALCAREFGKPAVSNIDIHNVLRTGMLVSVDGYTGTVTILEESSSAA